MKAARACFAAVVAASLLGLGACGGSGAGSGSDGDASGVTEPTDARGNPISEGDDWSRIGNAGAAAGFARDADGSEGSDEQEAAGEAAGSVDCGVPTTSPEQAERADELPPGADQPFGEPENDFLLEASMTPERGDPGVGVELDAIAVGQPQALIVMIVRFADGDSHGMRAAKFADVAGRAEFSGPVPATAPVGLATVTVSASNSDGASALEVLEFVVTGPGCP